MLSFETGERGERESLKMKENQRVGLGETEDSCACSSYPSRDTEMLL